jgi:hypothetical protein
MASSAVRPLGTAIIRLLVRRQAGENRAQQHTGHPLVHQLSRIHAAPHHDRLRNLDSGQDIADRPWSRTSSSS